MPCAYSSVTDLSYERISHQQNQAVSNILSGPCASGSFQEEVAAVKAVNMKSDLEEDLDAAFAKDLTVLDSIPMDFLFQ